jgi:hypothetical protein
MEFSVFAHKMLEFILVSCWPVFRFPRLLAAFVFGLAVGRHRTHPPAPNFVLKPNPIMKMKHMIQFMQGMRVFVHCVANRLARFFSVFVRSRNTLCCACCVVFPRSFRVHLDHILCVESKYSLEFSSSSTNHPNPVTLAQFLALFFHSASVPHQSLPATLRSIEYFECI